MKKVKFAYIESSNLATMQMKWANESLHCQPSVFASHFIRWEDDVSFSRVPYPCNNYLMFFSSIFTHCDHAHGKWGNDRKDKKCKYKRQWHEGSCKRTHILNDQTKVRIRTWLRRNTRWMKTRDPYFLGLIDYGFGIGSGGGGAPSAQGLPLLKAPCSMRTTLHIVHNNWR